MLILLSTYNGAEYLQAQLDSLLAQTHADWTLFWRDDGSTDATVAILEAFTVQLGADRCIRVRGPAGRVWPAASFLTLLRAAAPALREVDAVAFADQDDVWLPDKLHRGLDALGEVDPAMPTLYCARLRVVDAQLHRLGDTSISARRSGFPAALTQNIATGCTVMLNRRAAALVSASRAPPASPHDWWCYLLITAAGGRLLVDDAPVALYRQHANNVVGMSLSRTRRAVAALRRGPGVFMNVLRQHVVALATQPELLSEPARADVARLRAALQGGALQRLSVLRLAGLRRQSRLETWLFRVWFLIG